uniref:Uncharacterized protein n=1 Tax=Nelumbo nucifera TaxID=4432 RepID=A0A822ZIT8_NELNU|nr:TPA_asm: hypothetical protein HUJ06_001615 [Nelumbo nucifera]
MGDPWLQSQFTQVELRSLNSYRCFVCFLDLAFEPATLATGFCSSEGARASDNQTLAFQDVGAENR